jgi:ABC-type multidrug transport system permease subunit
VKTRGQIQRLSEQIKKDPEVGAVQKIALTTFFTAFDNFLGTPKVAGPDSGAPAMEPQISEVAITRQREGPPNAYSISFPQSILWGILGCSAGFAITLVRERTSGTLVRLLTAPISHATILAGKALACLISCCVVTAVLTSVGVLFFGVRISSVPLLVLATACAGACFAGLTMLLGSLGKTEQAVSGVAWGTLLMMAMLGGGMVPQIAMPAWMLQAGAVSPARWAIGALEGAIWRDFSFGEMMLPCGVLLAMAGPRLPSAHCVSIARNEQPAARSRRRRTGLARGIGLPLVAARPGGVPAGYKPLRDEGRGSRTAARPTPSVLALAGLLLAF